MNLHTLSNTRGAKRPARRVGRGMGSGVGKTCGRGHKGQLARKGHKRKAGFEGGQMPLVRRLPKRGFHSPTGTVYVPVNVGDLARFDDGAEVTPAALKEAGLVKGRGALVKILGNGELDRKLTVKAGAFSAGARAKIESAGGSCEVVKD